ncbi:UNVERIFIED_CONTAM: hypothetical protein HDU68_000416 [Siphonaria sp. JEL0065]|nr:hypothetical protein HDU68_000416 [Siphonaria sp. JEL0065]
MAAMTGATPLSFFLANQQILVRNIPASIQDILYTSEKAIRDLFASTACNSHRLIYALAGVIFHGYSPLPFGGSKSSPGYVKFQGDTPDQLLTFIVLESFSTYFQLKGREAVDLVAEAANRVYTMHMANQKDPLDELVMQGLKKSGHIAWIGCYIIPQDVRHVKEKKQSQQ